MKIGGLFDIGFSNPQTSPAPTIPTATRSFVLGQWQLQINPEGTNIQNDSSIIYYDDGTLTGKFDEIVGNQAVMQPVSGTWSFQKLSDHEFRLTATINGDDYQKRFRIFDANHIQNEDDNYVATRMP